MDLGIIFRAVVKSWTTFETSLGTIARARQLMLDMPAEREASTTPPMTWPSEGGVTFHDVYGGYSYVLLWKSGRQPLIKAAKM
jgi:ATP-binding cassette subfamily C (CFTR/MRP) protein 1